MCKAEFSVNANQSMLIKINVNQSSYTDEDLGLRIESFAIINIRGVFTNQKLILSDYRHANIKRTYKC